MFCLAQPNSTRRNSEITEALLGLDRTSTSSSLSSSPLLAPPSENILWLVCASDSCHVRLWCPSGHPHPAAAVQVRIYPSIPLFLADNNCSSYAVDPQWQRKFSIIWAAGLAIAVLGSAPHIVRSLRNGRLFRGLITGVSESPKGYTPPGSNDVTPASSKRRVGAVIEWAWAWTLWTIPGVELDLGQSTSFFAF